MKTVAIVIPAFYKPRFSAEELISLEHLEKYLGKYDKYFIVPERLNVKKHKRKGFRFIKFPNKYFPSPKTYNRLLLSESFYNKFKDYRFVLIYQTDAIVFSNQLLKWCNSGYDYIAAPWFRPIIGSLSHTKGSSAIVGNGGFCLRNVQKSLKILKKVKNLSKRSSSSLWIRRFWFLWAVMTRKSHKIWLNAPADNYPFNEDGFWSLEAPKYLSGFKNTPFKVAIKFAFERFPRKCFELNGGRLPFGCHAWQKYDKGFWVPYIKNWETKGK